MKLANAATTPSFASAVTMVMTRCSSAVLHWGTGCVRCWGMKRAERRGANVFVVSDANEIYHYADHAA